MSAAVHNREPPREGAVFGLRDVSAALEEFKALQREPHHEQLPALQSKMNEISEQMSNHGCLLRQMSEVIRRTSSEEDWDSGNRMPWHMEQRHILRKLNILATDTLARVQHAKAPVSLEATPAISCLFIKGQQWCGVPAIGSLLRPTHWADGGQAIGYVFLVSNMKTTNLLLADRSVLGVITQWHSEHLYFTMALIVEKEKDRLEISFRFGGTVGSASSQRSVLNVAILKEEVPPHFMQEVNEADVRCDDFGSQQAFWSRVSKIRTEDLLYEDGSMVITVSLVV